jgi:hypothetical protein
VLLRRVLLCTFTAVALLAAPAHAREAGVPDIQHVWIVVLENKDYKDTFGPDTEAPYLARELTKTGQLLPNYFGTSHLSLGNYVTMVSGQTANPLTQSDCMVSYNDVFPGTPLDNGQVLGWGCVYPRGVKTIVNQLEAKGLTWRGYMEDMGNTPGQPSTCRHPAVGTPDPTQNARPTDQYAVRHNPFVYFHDIIDFPTCQKNVVPLSQLTEDIKNPATTPNFAFVTPDLCNDAHDASCADGGLGGLPAADKFLKLWVPRILGSPGFAQHGLLIVTYDEANQSSTAACCSEPTGPNTPLPGITGPGGGQTGTVLISPYITPGGVNKTAYNHLGLLRSLEDIFNVGYLGYAAQAGLKAFGTDVYTNPAGAPVKPPPTGCIAARSGNPVAALRLRTRLLTFRARRSVRVTITARLKNGKTRVVKRLKLKACKPYSLLAPKTVTRITVSGAGRLQRVGQAARGAS